MLVILRKKNSREHVSNSEQLPRQSGPGSSVGIATGYGLDGPGIEFRWRQDFPHLSRPTLGPPSLLYNGYRVFPGGKERPERDTDPSPPSSAVVMKGQSYTSTPPMSRTVSTDPQCMYKGALQLTLLLRQSCLNLIFESDLGKCIEVDGGILEHLL